MIDTAKRLEKTRAKLASNREEFEWLSAHPTSRHSKSARRLVALCRTSSKLENLIADLEFESHGSERGMDTVTA